MDVTGVLTGAGPFTQGVNDLNAVRRGFVPTHRPGSTCPAASRNLWFRCGRHWTSVTAPARCRRAGPPRGARDRACAVLLHLRLEEVTPAAHELVARPRLEPLERRVVVVVVLLDDLEGPSPLDHVPADELGLELVGQGIVTGLSEEVDGISEGEVGGPRHPVEAVEAAARVLDDLERLGQLAERLDGGIVDSVRTAVLGDRQVLFVHDLDSGPDRAPGWRTGPITSQ